MGKIYGYCRISKPTQRLDRQVENISKAYPTADIRQEAYTGTKVQGRKVFEKLLHEVQKGDTIVFDSVSRMSRNAEEGIQAYEQLFAAGVELVFLKEPNVNTAVYRQARERQLQALATTGDHATDTFINAMFEALNAFMIDLARQQVKIAFDQAEKEVTDLQQRTKEGIKEARKRGAQIGQKEGNKLTTKKSIAAKEIIKKHNKGFGGSLSNEETWKLAGISKMTFYKYQKELMEELNK